MEKFSEFGGDLLFFGPDMASREHHRSTVEDGKLLLDEHGLYHMVPAIEKADEQRRVVYFQIKEKDMLSIQDVLKNIHIFKSMASLLTGYKCRPKSNPSELAFDSMAHSLKSYC